MKVRFNTIDDFIPEIPEDTSAIDYIMSEYTITELLADNTLFPEEYANFFFVLIVGHGLNNIGDEFIQAFTAHLNNPMFKMVATLSSMLEEETKEYKVPVVDQLPVEVEINGIEDFIDPLKDVRKFIKYNEYAQQLAKKLNKNSGFTTGPAMIKALVEIVHEPLEVYSMLYFLFLSGQTKKTTLTLN